MNTKTSSLSHLTGPAEGLSVSQNSVGELDARQVKHGAALPSTLISILLIMAASLPTQSTTNTTASPNKFVNRLRSRISTIHARLAKWHTNTPYLRQLPLPALLIIFLLLLINLISWAIVALVLSSHSHNQLLGTAALAYSLGLRHALDADHISAIDLMTRRLIATGQRPVTVGTFFSLGHSTIVIVTCIVVAATAAGVSKRFDGFSYVGGIVGTSVSAVFLLALGAMNAYILWKLYVQLKKVIALQPAEATSEGLKFEGGGCLFRSLKRLFRLIDRPWKMYPLGVLFGLGFDTSSEVALLGISGVEGSKGTGIWLIMLFPLLFTVGMCLIDTMDGALMMSLYVAPMKLGSVESKTAGEAANEILNVEGRSNAEDLVALDTQETTQLATKHPPDIDLEQANPQIDSKAASQHQTLPLNASDDPSNTASTLLHIRAAVADPLPFLYYSFILTTLTVICAVVIGMIQLLTLILNVASPSGRFWDGVAKAGDSYDIIGGGICGMFIVVGGASVAFYGKWRGWVDAKREKRRMMHAVEMERQEARQDTPVGTNSGKEIAMVGVAAVVEEVGVRRDGEARCSHAGIPSDSASHVIDRERPE